MSTVGYNVFFGCQLGKEKEARQHAFEPSFAPSLHHRRRPRNRTTTKIDYDYEDDGEDEQRQRMFQAGVKQVCRLGCLILLVLFLGQNTFAATTNTAPVPPATHGTTLVPFRLNLGVESARQPQDVDVALQILVAITLLTIAPSIILLMTSFTRIAIVLSFVRSALTLQGTPANQIIIGLSLFITFFIMAPVWEKIQRDALQPYQAKQITGDQALERTAQHLRSFMLKQARAKDVELFVAMAKIGPTPPQQLPLKIVIPSFIISELKTAFQMGFLLFVPFILIDLVVATVLMSMGMMMMPPMTIALPLKILLFVLVDGWGLVVRSVVQSFIP